MLGQNGFFALMLLLYLWYSVQECSRDACVCEECAPSFPVVRLLVRSSFGDFLGRFEDASSDNIWEIISLGVSLMWNDAAV